MYKIQLLNKISPIGLAVLDDRYEASETVEKPDGIILRSADMHGMELDQNVKAIARAGAGTNNIPIDRYSEQGIVVFNTPGANANAVKEMVFASLLLSSRKVFPALNWSQSQQGEADVAALAEKMKASFSGPELHGKTLGVIGLGAIGILVSNLAEQFGMTVYGYDPYLSVDAAWKISTRIHHAASLDEIYTNCDYITLHVPQTEDTKDMINKDTIAMMKDQVRILNFARGGLVNNNDIIDAVNSGKVYHYVTDFAASELLGNENILVLPHLGASTPESEENCAEMAAWEIRDFLEHGNIRNSVNLPTVTAPRKGPRITVFHQNRPSMIAKISGSVGENINNLVNSSKGDYAYTILDLDTPAKETILDEIKKIDGVIRVRLLG